MYEIAKVNIFIKIYMENYFEIRILNVRKDCNMRMLSLENINGQVELSEYSGYINMNLLSVGF